MKENILLNILTIANPSTNNLVLVLENRESSLLNIWPWDTSDVAQWHLTRADPGWAGQSDAPRPPPRWRPPRWPTRRSRCRPQRGGSSWGSRAGSCRPTWSRQSACHIFFLRQCKVNAKIWSLLPASRGKEHEEHEGRDDALKQNVEAFYSGMVQLGFNHFSRRIQKMFAVFSSFTPLYFERISRLVSAVLDHEHCQAEDEARHPGHHVGCPPALAENIEPGQVNTGHLK